MHQALTAVGVPAELHIFDGAGHAFDLVPELGRVCATLLTVFLDRHVLPGPGAGKTTGRAST
jgi:acetyl esterase/lipase